jgi:hypothetical protein
VGPRAVLDAVVKRKIPSPLRESNPRTPIVQPIDQRLSFPGSRMEDYGIRKQMLKHCTTGRLDEDLDVHSKDIRRS